jgi:hypothetical protein
MTTTETEKKTVISESGSESESVEVQYDDELDENFEDDLPDNMKISEMKQTVKSFENPKGLDEIQTPSSINFDGKRIDDNTTNALLEQFRSMPRKDLMKILQRVKKEKEYDNTKNDFSSVSPEHKQDASQRLRMKLNDMKKARKSRNIK